MRVSLKLGPGQVYRALTTFSLAAQELQLLGAGSSVVNCLLEGAVQLGPGSVLQHCHLQVRPESRGRGQARLWGPGPMCVGGGAWSSTAPSGYLPSPLPGTHSHRHWLLCEWPGHGPVRGAIRPGAARSCPAGAPRAAARSPCPCLHSRWTSGQLGSRCLPCVPSPPSSGFGEPPDPSPVSTPLQGSLSAGLRDRL